MCITQCLVGHKIQHLARLAQDVEAHGDITRGDMHHKVRVTISCECQHEKKKADSCEKLMKLLVCKSPERNDTSNLILQSFHILI